MFMIINYSSSLSICSTTIPYNIHSIYTFILVWGGDGNTALDGTAAADDDRQ